ncbi:MAG: UbiA family prenyltransferase [Pseudomonadota bacterium]
MTAKDRRADRHDDNPVLVVDLDGTLIRSDSLYECFWLGLSKTWKAFPTAVSGLMGGRAALKKQLAELADLDAEFLPYNDEVCHYIRTWRDKGGRAVLVTAADQSVADKVAAHIGLFDEVIGSDGATNLKGEEKAQLLRDRFANEGYAYMGDSSADIPVWESAKTAITVNAAPAIERQVRAMAAESEALNATRKPPAYLAALRPHQWLKNVLVFLPIMAAQAFEPAMIFNALLAFAAFSLVSSSGYVFNDLMDLRADRAHPRKSARPFAAGRVPIAHGTMMVPLLLLVGLILAAFATWQAFWIIALYFMLTTVYSLYLKRRAIADICTLAGLYTLRIIAGGLATGLGLSVWLLAFSMFFFFALAAVKRQAELVDLSGRGIPTARRRGYNVDDLPMVSQITVASGFVSVLVLALYLNSPGVQELYTTPWLLWGICLILLYWISRIALKAHRGQMDDDPIVYALRDKTSLACVSIMIACAVGAAVL